VELAAFHPLEDEEMSARVDDGDGHRGASGRGPGGGGLDHLLRARIREAPAICDIHGGG
jgi:hypothetical protein